MDTTNWLQFCVHKIIIIRSQAKNCTFKNVLREAFLTRQSCSFCHITSHVYCDFSFISVFWLFPGTSVEFHIVNTI